MQNAFLTSDLVTLSSPWYEPETFLALMNLMDDKEALFLRYDSWHSKAERTEEQLRRRGVMPVRVVLDAVHFPKWCATNLPGMKINAEARAAYATAMTVTGQ